MQIQHRGVELGLGHLFSVMTAAIAPGTALSTAPPFALWNPVDSRVEIVIKRLEVAYVSGTLGAGHLMFADVAQPTKPTGGTEITNLIKGARRGATPAPASVANAFAGSTVVQPVAFRPAHNIGSGPDIPPAEDLGFSLLPGNLLAVEEVGAAGSSPLVRICLTWAEYAIG